MSGAFLNLTTMTLNIENLVRSGVILAVGIPIVLGVNGSLSTLNKLALKSSSDSNVKDDAVAELKGKLAEPCLRYIMAKPSSKLEDKARIEIDEIVGGDTMHGEVCRYVLR